VGSVQHGRRRTRAAVGIAAALLDQIAGDAATAAYVGLVIASQLPFPVMGILADMGADVLEGHVPPELAMAKKALGTRT
jgi:hypothetical protein